MTPIDKLKELCPTDADGKLLDRGVLWKHLVVAFGSANAALDAMLEGRIPEPWGSDAAANVNSVALNTRAAMRLALALEAKLRREDV